METMAVTRGQLRQASPQLARRLCPDPGVVQSALAAGVSQDALVEMSNLLSSNPARRLKEARLPVGGANLRVPRGAAHLDQRFRPRRRATRWPRH